MNKFWFYVYSWSNIAGCAAALLGLALHLSLALYSEGGGLAYWVVIVPGLYVFGYLLGYLLQNNQANLHTFLDRENIEAIREQLNALLKQTHKRLPKALFAKLEHIVASVEQVLPLLTNQSPSREDLFTLKQTVFDYLPTTLEHYLRLPTPYASMHTLRNGKTAQQLLADQLDLIDTTLQKIVDNFYADDMNALLTNQRFLKERLQDAGEDFWA